MRIKDYSLRIRKNIAVILHIIFLAIAVGGISFLYMNNQLGSGVSWLTKSSYEDSEQFQQQFQEDLDHILHYVAYRDVFEEDGVLDLSSPMFSVARGDNPEIIYTLEEVLRYAKSQGFYLNDQFEVVNDLFIYDNASTSRDQYINWRAYDPNATLSEPGDAYISLLDLSREVLECLSEYYIVHYRMLVNPTNFYFRVVYQDADGEEIDASYTNAEDRSTDELMALGRYCFLDSESIFIDTNLSEIPKNVAVSMEKNNATDSESYYLIAAVDTSYEADDVYADQAAEYQQMREHFFEGLASIAIGIIGCLITLYDLIMTAGYRTADRQTPYLHGFDTITTESCLFMAVLCTLFALFLGEKIGYPLIHLMVSEDSWEFAERMMRAVIIYGCSLIAAFSLLRRYKCRQLWKNSLLHHTLENLELYFTDSTFSRRILYTYVAFVAAQVVIVGLIAVSIHFWRYPAARIIVAVLILGLGFLDFGALKRLYSTSTQEDRIADAISMISSGDTAYQMDLDGLTGKELKMGHMINSIGTGLEQALQEQLKSERMKADLITNVSHDIKTPLTSIISYVDLLKRENLPGEKAKEYLEILDQKSQRLKNLTEDLVEVSKASSGNLKLDMVKINLVEMIWQTNGEFEEKFAERYLELVSSLPDESICIMADGRRLWRVLENLYNNAYKYAMEHSRVYTDLSRDGKMVFFTIKNVSEVPLNVNADELTERFVRGDVSRATEGSGLGLSIAQSLTRLQKGSFEIIIDGDLFKVLIGFPVVE
ncbi:MAG: HAMP domain-containing histidine kinase [Clostridiales bacterium]|nr:HAMP domain-containing histidine kinase [Clostridiales bacterium]